MVFLIVKTNKFMKILSIRFTTTIAQKNSKV